MTRDEALKIAAECGNDNGTTLKSDLDFLERFAALVAAAEREACARICEDRQQQYNTSHYPQELAVIRAVAAAIRARGDA